ncbi:YecA family protein [Ornithinibacillus salinisoli]|uniref:YecA family protein n=1 Tax=Ornithinibacillus salinisoli TaxID=1848459 RepID=A0ABW4VYP4_9BACI
MNIVIDYIISLSNLYGLVHRDKVVEIYNLQNEEKIDKEKINTISMEFKEDLKKGFTEIHGDYFVTDSILQFGDFEEELRKRLQKPFYIPGQEELLNYKKNCYFEVNEEYNTLLDYLMKYIYSGDNHKAEILCEYIQGMCRYGFSLQQIMDEFNDRGINFKDEKQINKVIQLVMDLANNTRLPENNGYTPRELSGLMEKSMKRPIPSVVNQKERTEKVGRNVPCICGSGKKYKKCCMGNA